MKKLLLALLVLAGIAAAQPNTTIVTDTIRTSTGALAQGTITVTPNQQFETSHGVQVYPIGIIVPVVNGVFSVHLYPNDATTDPASGTSYSARYGLINEVAPIITETWVVTTGGPLNLAQVRTNPTPIPVGLIPLSLLSTAGAVTGNCIVLGVQFWAPGSCGAGGGGAFSAITSGVNNSGQTLTVGSTSILTTSGSGIINANEIGGVAVSIPLLPAVGGTGTSTVFTPGSVIYAGTSGIYNQDPSHFSWDSTDHCLAIDTVSCVGTNVAVLGITGSDARIRIDNDGTHGSYNTFYLGGVFKASIGTNSDGSFAIFDPTRNIDQVYVTPAGLLALQPNSLNVVVGGATPTAFKFDVQSSDTGGSFRVFDQRVAGNSVMVFQEGAAQTSALFAILSHAGAIESAFFPGGNLGVPFLEVYDTSYNPRAQISFGNGFTVGAAQSYNFSSTSLSGGSIDLSLVRSASGVLGIYDGTTNPRDLLLRNITAIGLGGSGNQCLQSDNTGHISISGIGACGTGGSGGTPYTTTVSSVASATILAATHNQGTTPTATAYATNGTTYSVTGATAATPIVITVASTTGLTLTTVVGVTGSCGVTGIDGIFQVASITGTTFQLVGSVGTGGYTSGCSVAVAREQVAVSPYIDAAGNVLYTFTPNFTGLLEVTNGAGGGGGGGGSVTSVGLAPISGLFTVTGSPVTGSGTLTPVLSTQSINTFFSGPCTGSAATPTFRGICLADEVASGASGLIQFSNGTTLSSATNFHYTAGNDLVVGGNAVTTSRVDIQSCDTGGCLQLYDQGGSGNTLGVIRAGAAQSTNLLSIMNNGGTVVAAISSLGNFTAGIFAAVSTGTNVCALVATSSNSLPGLECANNSVLGWSSTTTWTGTLDAGIARNTAGVIEIDNGTPGTLRDLLDRNTISSTIQLKGSSAGVITTQAPASFTSWTETKPTTAGTVGYFLTTDGFGVESWTAPGSCALCVVTTGTPTAGVAHFAGGTQTITGGYLIVNADITAATIATSKLASLQGSDANVMTSPGSLSGTGALLCLDSNGGATTAGCSTSVLWSSIGSAISNTTLLNGTNTTTFDQTNATLWTWANTTNATSSTSQGSPIHDLCGTYWTGSASGTDCWTMQAVPANGANGDSLLSFSHTGSTAGSPTISYISNYGFASQPTFTITAATNATPIVVTVSSTAGLSANSIVELDHGTCSGSCAGSAPWAGNGAWTITSLTGTQFTLVGSAGNGTYAASSATAFLMPFGRNLELLGGSMPASLPTPQLLEWAINGDFAAANVHVVNAILNIPAGTLYGNSPSALNGVVTDSGPGGQYAEAGQLDAVCLVAGCTLIGLVQGIQDIIGLPAKTYVCPGATCPGYYTWAAGILQYPSFGNNSHPSVQYTGIGMAGTSNVALSSDATALYVGQLGQDFVGSGNSISYDHGIWFDQGAVKSGGSAILVDAAGSCPSSYSQPGGRLQLVSGQTYGSCVTKASASIVVQSRDGSNVAHPMTINVSSGSNGQIFTGGTDGIGIFAGGNLSLFAGGGGAAIYMNDPVVMQNYAGAANRPVCFTSTGQIYAGSNTGGTLSCP